MRVLLAGLMTFALIVVTGSSMPAGEKDKEVTLEGKICCLKCELGKSKKCETVIVVTKDKKDVVYLFDTAGHKKYHGKICTEAKEGSATGTVDEKKLVITVKEVKFK